ncbi:tafazzin [Hirsutella rhossiliensis]|uniref:Tafazzin n=1 Tax=Hirsutella rhossiliensis TaxID=111463 RepID=A0A9P8N2R3_9HYPO|nr:tafazzin [Hirsutella rhossiliensis]KAH0965785.1 tafazzin [Hirsutella rhossiliensis]
MPRKRPQVKSFKPNPVASSAQSSAPSASADKNRAPASVNQLLANLRRASTASSAARPVPTPAPSLPPAIREVLQLPETPAPLPRRAARQRFDEHGRRLPAGPAPPRSWLSKEYAETAAERHPGRSSRVTFPGPAQATLPGAYMPAPGSFIDILLRRLALDWEAHRVYNQYHLYSLPSHLKTALIRYIGVAAEQGASVADLKVILLPPAGAYSDDDDDHTGRESTWNCEISCLDLSGSIGRSLQPKDVSRLLFPLTTETGSEQVKDSWDAADPIPSPPRVLLPNLTHLSLALDPTTGQDASWKQLLALSSKLSAVTHLSLAFWPAPCQHRPRQHSFVAPFGGPESPEGGPRDSMDGDWSETLLVLRLLSRNLYRLEYLDLTGCVSWFEALKLENGHDFVDWVWAWGKLGVLRLYAGWTPGEDALPSERLAHGEAAKMARSIERHIVAKRAGKAMFITVEHDEAA